MATLRSVFLAVELAAVLSAAGGKLTETSLSSGAGCGTATEISRESWGEGGNSACSLVTKREEGELKTF